MQRDAQGRAILCGFLKKIANAAVAQESPDTLATLSDTGTAHFGRRLVGESHGQDARRAHLLGLDQPGDARGQNAGLAATRTGQDQRGLRGQGHSGQLLGIELVQ